ncbi:MAG: cupredoxin domain-containing protein [Actinomycetota bacterium]
MRTLNIGLAGALALGGLAACSGSNEAVCENPVSTTSVEMADFSYDPSCTAAPADATLTISNVGKVPHTFTVSDTHAAVDVAAGESGTLDLAGVAPGTYRVFCTYHPNMEAALRVG